MSIAEQDFAYIGRAPCGCVRFATVDTPEHAKDNAKEIAKVIKAGYTIERVTVAFVRSNWGPGCAQCDPDKAKRAKAAALSPQMELGL